MFAGNLFLVSNTILCLANIYNHIEQGPDQPADKVDPSFFVLFCYSMPPKRCSTFVNERTGLPYNIISEKELEKIVSVSIRNDLFRSQEVGLS